LVDLVLFHIEASRERQNPDLRRTIKAIFQDLCTRSMPELQLL